MGAVIFSDVHADAAAIEALSGCIKTPAFLSEFGPVDFLVNLGDLIDRGNHPKEVLEKIHSLKGEYQLISVLGNHDHAFLNGITIRGSDPESIYRHEAIRHSHLFSVFNGIPMEWVIKNVLFVHGGPLELGNDTLRLKCWQRLSHESGDFFTGYHYTAKMAFNALEVRGIMHMCCGHQHHNVCCRKTLNGIIPKELNFRPRFLSADGGKISLEVATVSLDVPTILRIGGCQGIRPEFAYTDFSKFSFIRMVKGNSPAAINKNTGEDILQKTE